MFAFLLWVADTASLDVALKQALLACAKASTAGTLDEIERLPEAVRGVGYSRRQRLEDVDAAKHFAGKVVYLGFSVPFFGALVASLYSSGGKVVASGKELTAAVTFTAPDVDALWWRGGQRSDVYELVCLEFSESLAEVDNVFFHSFLRVKEHRPKLPRGGVSILKPT